MARVLIVDDFLLARAGIRAVLEDSAMVVLPDAADSADALAAIRSMHPDLVIIDPAMCDGGGLEVIQRCKLECPETRILALTISTDLALVAASIDAGCDGYLLKTVTQAGLVDAVERVVDGEVVIDAHLAMDVVRGLHRSDPTDTLPEPLTPREREVLSLVSRGHTNREIGTRLFMALGTVKVHVEHILAKLGVPDRTSAAVEAARLGLVGGHAADPESAARPMPPGAAYSAARQIPRRAFASDDQPAGTQVPGRVQRTAQRNRT